MKKIVIEDVEYLYHIFDFNEGYTKFYLGYEEYTIRKYWLFGEKTSIAKPKEVFTVYFDIEDPHYTKEYVKTRILEKIKILNRKKEIEKGEIV